MFEKLTWTCGLFVIFSSCFTKTEDVSNREISADQRKIQMLVDSFKRLANEASTLTTKDSIRLSYAAKFYDLLSNIGIDSIRVHVVSVKIVDSTISTQFHCG